MNRNEFIKIGGNWAIRRGVLIAASSKGTPWLYAFKYQAMEGITQREPAMWVPEQ